MSDLMTTKQAAEYLSVSRQFLERDRWKGATIPFVRVGTRAVRYRVKDLDGYLDAKTVHARP